MAPAPAPPGQRWSTGFVHDQLVKGRLFRVLTVVDNWSRESPGLAVGFRLTGSSVVEALSRVGKTVRLPACITVDHSTEFTSRALDFWAWENKVPRCSLTSRALESLRATGFASNSMVDCATNV
ncbi:MAG: DDE-type integrase/transposase/recombinase [Nitrosospira sp.]